MSIVYNNYFWGAIRLCLGGIVAALIWKLALNEGKLVYLFASAIAVALSGLLSLLTNKSFSQLSVSWSKVPKLAKLIFIPVMCVVLWFGVLILGIIFTRSY